MGGDGILSVVVVVVLLSWCVSSYAESVGVWCVGRRHQTGYLVQAVYGY